MADIVISGDSSGSVTLRAPAVSGTTVLTLPTTSGTLVTTAGGSTVPFALGSAAAPSITFTGDTNTGMFSPGADTIAFTEGGVESMRITSAGNLGVGTDTPTVRLDVRSGTGVMFNVQESTSGDSRRIRFSNSGTVNTIESTTGSGSTQLAFAVDGTERMRIDSSGNVGIGTSSPSTFNPSTSVNKNLTVFTGDQATTLLAYWQAGVDQYSVLRASNGANTGITNMRYEANTHIFLTSTGASGTERMRIDSSGGVQIGRNNVIGTNNRLAIQMAGTTASGYTAASNAALAIDAGTATNSVLNLVGGGDMGIYRSNSSGAFDVGIGFGDNSNRILRFDIASIERMRIDSSGNVAIGQATEVNARLLILGTNNTKVQANHNASTGQSFFSNGYSAAGTGWNHFNGVSSNNSVQNILIYGNGNIQNANNSYGALSDIKLKENIVDATPKLEKLLQVRIRNYNLKGDYEQHKQLGVVAQELEQIFPSLVEETADKDVEGKDLGTTTKGVKYSVFVPMLIKAIQELNAKVTALEKQLGAK
jgi:hypothetical protein